MRKISITISDNPNYYKVNVMGNPILLITSEELLDLYDDINNIIIDNERLWQIR